MEVRGEKYISKPDMKRRKVRLDDFEYMNEFSKLKIDRMSDEELENEIRKYITTVLLDQSTKPFSDFARIHYKYQRLKSESGYKVLRDYFQRLQQSLKEKMGDVRKKLQSHANNELLSFDGKVCVIYNSESNRYETKYLPIDFDKEEYVIAEYPDIKIDCEMLKIQYFDIISYLLQEFPKDRFKVCERSKCGTPFFQATAREKIFCSSKCSKAAAQANYMEKK